MRIYKKHAYLLQTFHVLETLWELVSMDFIIGLPKMNRLWSIMVVVDCFLKYTISIVASHVCPADVAMWLFHKYMVKYFVFLVDIISDQDIRFIGRFWTTFFNMMGIELKFSTTNHPHNNGQTHRIDAFLEFAALC